MKIPLVSIRLLFAFYCIFPKTVLFFRKAIWYRTPVSGCFGLQMNLLIQELLVLYKRLLKKLCLVG